MNRPLLRKTLAWSIVAITLITGGIVSYLLLTGPHMIYQANLRPHQAIMPDLPEGTVPVRPIEFPAPATQEAGVLTNPLEPTQANLAQGKVYYEYYCIFCHDANGSGSAQVGRSYTPAPTDLREARLRQFSDGEYLQRSLTGQGHSPVLEEIIPPAYRWHIVLYARAFSRGPASPRP
jgi:mono/diheme cytochrome c family protein